MQSPYGNADGDAGPGTPSPVQGAFKRRLRVDSNPLATWGPAALPPDPKRPRADGPTAANAAAMSAKALGKRPDMPIDLTGPATHAPRNVTQLPHHRRPATAFQPHAGAKKLVVKNLRAAPSAPVSSAPAVQDYYRRARDELDAALTDVFRGRQPTMPLDRLFRAVEDLCRNGQAAELHARLYQRCEAHLSDVVLPRIEAHGAGYGIEMLRTVHRQWMEWSAQAVTIRSTFSYLDRTFLLNNKQHASLNDMAIALFRQMLFSSRSKNKDKGKEREGDRCAMAAVSAPGAHVVSGLCLLVELDRLNQDGFDPHLLKSAVNMLHVFNVYGKYFEPRLLSESRTYFTNFAEERSASRSLKQYITEVKALLQREETRCNAYSFDSTTKKQLLDDLHRIAVQGYCDKLLSRDDVSRLLDENEVNSLQALYELLRMCGLHARLVEPWESYVVSTGYSIVNDAERGDEMVIRLLDLRRRLDVIVRDSFNKDGEFTRTLRSAFGTFVNDRKGGGKATSKVGEMVAKYIDMLLRGGLKTLPASFRSDLKDRVEAEQTGLASAGDEDAELGRQLDQGLELFRFIDGKDVFEAFYKRDLARRLLLGRSASQDAERVMLTKLRDECGASFTHNLEQMFKDQEVSKDELNAYKSWRRGTAGEADGRSKLDLTVTVLSKASWPSYSDEPSVVLPPGVAEHLADFEKYYKSKHTGRYLTWKHSLSHCVLRARFPQRGDRELVVSAHQAAVLALFNKVADDAPIACSEIEKLTGLTGDLLERVLQSLACGKVRVLTKAPKGRDVAKTDTFVVNRSFNDPKFRVKINQIQLRETKEENRETHERVAADRQFETQAAIVRIMKSRKTMPHAQLVAEVIEQTRRRGALDPAEIKVNIEKLIDKDYIEREGNQYTYLA